MTDAQARSFSPIFWILGPKRWSSAVRRSGKEGKRARGPFSATRTSWKLKLDGFSSSRGALHDQHHEKPPNTKNPAAVGRRPRGQFGGGAPGGISIAPRCSFPHRMQNHYLSLTASGARILFTRGHKPNQKPRENTNLQDRRQYLGIHGTFSIARPSGKPASSVNFTV